MLPIDEAYKYECIIGSNQKIKFRPWKTKDEKSFLTYIETVDEVSDEDFYDYLIKPCLEKSDIHLSDADLQMLLIEIRKVSIGPEFEMKFICGNAECNGVNEVEVMFDDIITYKKDTVKEFEDKENEIKIIFGSVKNEALYKEKSKDAAELEKIFIELIMRIEKIYYKGETYDTFKYENAYEFINNLEVKVFDKLLAYYKENMSNINMEGDFDCVMCGHKNSFIFDEVPNFLAGW